MGRPVTGAGLCVPADVEHGIPAPYAHRSQLGRKSGGVRLQLPKLPAVDEPLVELAAYFGTRTPVPDQELIRLTTAARKACRRWDAIAAACAIRSYKDIAGVVSPACWDDSDTGAALLFGSAQYSLHKLTGSQSYFPPLRWDCPGCGQEVTDRAPAGGPSTSSTATRPAAPGSPLTRPPRLTSAASGCHG